MLDIIKEGCHICGKTREIKLFYLITPNEIRYLQIKPLWLISAKNPATLPKSITTKTLSHA